MFRLSIAALAALLISMGANSTATQAQTLCGARMDLVRDLKKEFAEDPIAMGLARTGAMVEVFSSATGSFSILMTQPSGTSCVVATGEGWEDLPKRLTGLGV
jgi:hypothetical protein